MCRETSKNYFTFYFGLYREFNEVFAFFVVKFFLDKEFFQIAQI